MAGELLAGDADGVTRAVESLLGLDFEHFTTCVVLPQGDFARFLHQAPRERQALLIRLLDLGVYATMASAAGDRAKLARVRRDLQSERLAELADRTPRQRDDLRQRRDRLAGLLGDLDASGPERDRLVRAVEAATARADTAAAWADRLEGLQAPEVLSHLGADLDRVEAEVAVAEVEAERAESQAEAAAEAVASQPARAELEVLLDRHDRRADAAAAADLAATALATAATTAEAARIAEAAAREAAAAAEADLDAAQAELTRREAELAALPGAAELQAVLRRHDELEQLVGRLAKGREVLDADERALADARAALAKAAAAVTSAEHELELIRSADLAADLAAGLRPGDPCPVCGQAVGHLALRHDEGRRTAAQAALAEARDRRAAEEERTTELGRSSAGAQELFRDLEQRFAALRDELTAGGTREQVGAELARIEAAEQARRDAAEAVEGVRRTWQRARDVSGPEQEARRTGLLVARAEQERHDRTRTLERLDAELAGQPAAAETRRRLDAALASEDAHRASLAALGGARQRLAAVRSEHAAIAARAEELWSRYDEVRDQLAPLDPPRPAARRLAAGAAAGVVDAWNELVTWAAKAGPRQRQAAIEARALVEDHGRALRQLIDSFVARAEALEIEVGDRVVRDAVVDAVSRLDAELARLESDLARAEVLAAQVAEATEAEQVAADLARHLQSNHFQKWLLEEAVARLVDGATEVLRQLSNGAYSFTQDRRGGNFAVVDHRNADGVRSARTLSGGETFLASLALALALAEQVAELAQGGDGSAGGAVTRRGTERRRDGVRARSSRLESIFLDEGFGTLDPETLDTVAGAIEELASLGRMVGVVSHVRDLAERLPVRFEVARGTGGATVTRLDGG